MLGGREPDQSYGIWSKLLPNLGQSFFVCQLKVLTGLSLRHLPVPIIYECELEKLKQFKDTLQMYKSRIFKKKNTVDILTFYKDTWDV